MGLVCIMIMWLCITFIKEKAKCSEFQVFAIPGCNATIEWALGRTHLETYVYSIKVFNANGIEIAQKEDMTCKYARGDSIYCEVRNISSQEWRFAVVLLNVSQALSGKYKGQINIGKKTETITKELKIIDKPQIKVTQTPILHEPFSVFCTVNGQSERIIYQWTLNGEDLNYTEGIDAISANLTFKRLTMEDKLKTVSCRVCLENNCCIESENYTPDPYYLPTVTSRPEDKKDLSTVVSSPGDNKGQHLEHYWIGPSIASFFLVIIGILILGTLRRINASSQIVPPHSSRPYGECVNSDNSVNKRCPQENSCPWPCSERQAARGSILVKMFARGNGENRVAPNDDNTGANSQTRNSSKRDNAESGLHENLYNTVNEAAVSDYNYIQDNLIKETSNMAGRSTEHEHYHYAISVELHQDTMAGINELDETYMTPVSDIFRPIKICENDKSNEYLTLEKDQDITNANYITPTPINDFPSQITICQAEDTNLHGTDPNYITPINDRADRIEICSVVDLDLSLELQDRK